MEYNTNLQQNNAELAKILAMAESLPNDNASGDYIPVPATAEVGQTIRVSAVDDSGKPTAWEAVDFPEGGGDWDCEWEYEHTVEVTPDTSATGFTIDLFDDGTELQLEKGIICVVLKHDGSVNSNLNVTTKISFNNNKAFGLTASTVYSADANTWHRVWIMFYKVNGQLIFEKSAGQGVAYLNYMSALGGAVNRDIAPGIYNTPLSASAQYVWEVQVGGGNASAVWNNGVIKIWGMRYKP